MTRVYKAIAAWCLVKDTSAFAVGWAGHFLDAGWFWTLVFISITDGIAASVALMIWSN